MMDDYGKHGAITFNYWYPLLKVAHTRTHVVCSDDIDMLLKPDELVTKGNAKYCQTLE